MTLGPLVAMAERDDKGEQKDYYGVVTCPDGGRAYVEGRCCEPGGVYLCGYVSCSNYAPPAVDCGPCED